MLNRLKKLCAQGENQFVEFKQYASEPNQVTEEVSGFLNSSGGKLLIGVSDDGTVSGLKYAEDDLNFISEYIKKNIKPAPRLQYDTIPVSSKRAVIIIEIPEGSRKPYRAFDPESGSSKIFYRVDDECIKASRELRSILKESVRKQGQTIVYSDIEAAVIKEIDKAGRLSKLEIQEKTKYNSRKVSDCLIRLVTSKVLTITPANSGDLYEYNQPA